MILMDGSGSVGSKGFKQEKEFADAFIKRFEVEPKKTEIGIISFSYYITIGSQITDDAPALLDVVSNTEWEAYNTNTAAALGTALEVLAASGRESAQSVVVVITDGMPNDSEATAMMAEKVKEKARLIFVAVGKNLDMDALYTWASFPPEFNILSAKKFKKLAKNLAQGEYLADICPSLVCRETLDGNGVDYIGCQTETETGKVCQTWTDNFPHEHRYAKKARKNKFNLGEHNFCRNPDDSETIWCYTTDPTTPWDWCVPRNETAYIAPDPLLR
jgi:uncharacterized protein YegL